MTKIDPQLKRYYDLRHRVENYESWCDKTKARVQGAGMYSKLRRQLRIRALNTGLPIPEMKNEQLRPLVEAYELGCAHCKSKEPLDLEHIKAIRYGGAPLAFNNLHWLCRTCHRKKTRVENLAALKEQLANLEIELKARGLLKRGGHYGVRT